MNNNTMVDEITTSEKVRKRGNSLYILLRKEICEKLNISENDMVEIKVKKLDDNQNEKNSS